LERNSKVTETTQGGRPVGRLDRAVARGGWFLVIWIGVLLILAGAVGGYILGRQRTYSDVASAQNVVLQLQSENQTLNRQTIEQSARLTTQQSKLNGVQAALSAIMPTENTYNINPNQSLIVADGHLTIGLIGSPSNEGVNININGKQQSVAAGDIIKVAVDPSTTCEVAVQSFDLFKAVLNASCPKAKPQ
jgi:hypothetical protein